MEGKVGDDYQKYRKANIATQDTEMIRFFTLTHAKHVQDIALVLIY